MDIGVSDIINGCIANDRRYQEYLYKTYYSSMMGMVRRYISSDIAEEVLNDGFMTIYKNIGKYGYRGSFEGFLRKIMFRAICNFVKSDKRISTYLKRSKGLYKEILWYGDNIDVVVEVGDSDFILCKDIYKYIDNLPGVTSSVFRLYIDGYKHSEISDILGMSEGTSKWHVNRARVLLREKFI